MKDEETAVEKKEISNTSSKPSNGAMTVSNEKDSEGKFFIDNMVMLMSVIEDLTARLEKLTKIVVRLVNKAANINTPQSSASQNKKKAAPQKRGRPKQAHSSTSPKKMGGSAKGRLASSKRTVKRGRPFGSKNKK